MICDRCRYRNHACRHRLSAVHELIEGHRFEDCAWFEPDDSGGWCLLVLAAVLGIAAAVMRGIGC